MSHLNVGSAMTGNLMCELLACDREEVLLCPDKLLRRELCLDRGGSITRCKSSLNLALTFQSTGLQIVCQLNCLCHLTNPVHFVPIQTC